MARNQDIWNDLLNSSAAAPGMSAISVRNNVVTSINIERVSFFADIEME